MQLSFIRLFYLIIIIIFINNKIYQLNAFTLNNKKNVQNISENFENKELINVKKSKNLKRIQRSIFNRNEVGIYNYQQYVKNLLVSSQPLDKNMQMYIVNEHNYYRKKVYSFFD